MSRRRGAMSAMKCFLVLTFSAAASTVPTRSWGRPFSTSPCPASASSSPPCSWGRGGGGGGWRTVGGSAVSYSMDERNFPTPSAGMLLWGLRGGSAEDSARSDRAGWDERGGEDAASGMASLSVDPTPREGEGERGGGKSEENKTEEEAAGGAGTVQEQARWYREKESGIPVTAAELHDYMMWRSWANLQKEDLYAAFDPSRVRVLVICKHNTIFSRAAEACIGSVAASAGFEGRIKTVSRSVGGGNVGWYMPESWSFFTGVEAPPELSQEALKRGLNVTGMSMPLQAPDLAQADVIIAIDDESADQAREAALFWGQGCPQWVSNKTKVLGDMSDAWAKEWGEEFQRWDHDPLSCSDPGRLFDSLLAASKEILPSMLLRDK